MVIITSCFILFSVLVTFQVKTPVEKFGHIFGHIQNNPALFQEMLICHNVVKLRYSKPYLGSRYPDICVATEKYP